ncbi:hypothetical protein [Pseudomonas sp. UBA4194]|uniref:hypothetical protein n=1 Tax=Pseudomonas sp. UBA4194 TaxID=1947317 RepID=UPI0025D95F1C|nr:hypothetical protein [Pseudomonas sp. UBA4194]
MVKPTPDPPIINLPPDPPLFHFPHDLSITDGTELAERFDRHRWEMAQARRNAQRWLAPPRRWWQCWRRG